VSQLAHDKRDEARRSSRRKAGHVHAGSCSNGSVTGLTEETYDAVMDIVKNHYGAYGIGVEYAYTMVHGAPATKFPEYAVPVAVAAHK